MRISISVHSLETTYDGRVAILMVGNQAVMAWMQQRLNLCEIDGPEATFDGPYSSLMVTVYKILKIHEIDGLEDIPHGLEATVMHYSFNFRSCDGLQMFL